MITREQAQKILEKDIQEQKDFYSVIVDGNRHNLGVAIKTKKEQITVKKCAQICAKLESKYGIQINKIQIFMSEYDYSGITADDYLAVLYNDCGLPKMIDKNAEYWPKKNLLRIWQDGLPVYENNNGVICKDTIALADSII